MAQSNYTTTVAIDAEHSLFHFYSLRNGKVVHSVRSYGGALFDTEFFDKFKLAVKDFVMENPANGVRKISAIIPDSAVLTDTIKIPNMKGWGQTKKTLDVTLGSLYLNYSELRLVSSAVSQNKQYTTYSIAAVQKRIASAIYTACSENKMLVDTLTYAANATISGVTQLNPKLKSASYLFLDLKDTYARFVFVANGRAVGSYSLPFGLEFLRKTEVVPEDMLFDHTFAELSVLNARETAKSKRLTVLAPDAVFEEEETDAEESVAEESAVSEDEDTESDGTEDAELTAMAEAVGTGKQPIPKLFKKKARKLPKFMQREIPESAEGILYENFRIFEKWALTLIGGNEKLTEIAKPGFVCVNIPDDLAYVLNKVNEEEKENGISFTALPRGNADSAVTSNLELYGGLFPKSISPAGKL
jgi:hypothetical protein